MVTNREKTNNYRKYRVLKVSVKEMWDGKVYPKLSQQEKTR